MKHVSKLHQFEVWDSHTNKYYDSRLQGCDSAYFEETAASSPTLKMDTAGAPAKHFQQFTELGRLTSQMTSLETRSMFHSMFTTSQKLQCLKIKRPKHTLCPKFLPRWQYGTANIMSIAYSSLYSWSFQIRCMHCQTSAADCYKYAVFTFRSVQLVVTDIPYANSDLYSCWL